MPSKQRYKIQQILFVLLGITIPTSIALTNMVLGSLVLCWILEGGLNQKLKHIMSSSWMVAVFLLIILYLLGMLWGDNHNNVSWQIQRLLLLLAFPVLITIDLEQKTIKKSVVGFLGVNFISAVLAILINNNIIQDLGTYISFIKSDWQTAAFIKYNYHNVLLSLSFLLATYIVVEVKTRYKYLFILFIIVYSISIFTERGRAGQVLFLSLIHI